MTKKWCKNKWRPKEGKKIIAKIAATEAAATTAAAQQNSAKKGIGNACALFTFSGGVINTFIMYVVDAYYTKNKTEIEWEESG